MTQFSESANLDHDPYHHFDNLNFGLYGQGVSMGFILLNNQATFRLGGGVLTKFYVI